MVTEVGLGATGLSITQTDSYVAGQESYRTDVTVVNAGPVARTARLYRAGDCVVGDVDDAFGSVDAATGAVACVGGEEGGDEDVPTPRFQQWFPVSAGSHYYLDAAWAPASGTTPPAELGHHGPAGGTVTRSHLTTFSLLGVMPLTISTIPRAPAATPGSVVTYTVVLANPSSVAVNVNSVVDTLPAGSATCRGRPRGSRLSTPLPPVRSSPDGAAPDAAVQPARHGIQREGG